MCSRKLFYLNYIKLMIKINKINKKIYMINFCGRVDTKKKSPGRLCGNKQIFGIGLTQMTKIDSNILGKVWLELGVSRFCLPIRMRSF